MIFENNIPIYIQVINQIKKDLILGTIGLGEKLPSTRELAFQYEVNPNTAARVYKELEIEKICFTKRGLGTFVTQEENKIKELKEEMAKHLLDTFLKGMKDLKFDMEEIIVLLRQQQSGSK